MTSTIADVDKDLLVRGGTDLMYVSLVARPGVDWSARSRLARTLNHGLAEAGVHSAHAHAGPEGIFVTMTGRSSRPAIDDLTDRLGRWRNNLNHTTVAPPSPPTSPAELVTALTFDTDNRGVGTPGDDELASILTSLTFDVVVGGGSGTDDLGNARDKIHGVVNCGAHPSGMIVPRVHLHPGQTSRRWAQVPVISSWVRWYRFVDAPRDDSERLARSLVNVAFGGVYGSHLVDYVRRQQGLSYSPQSTLLQRDGQHVLVIDVQTTPGDEEACDAAVHTALSEFSKNPLSVVDPLPSQEPEISEKVLAAARYLLGRTIVDQDSLQSAVDERAAVIEGSLPTALDTTVTPEHLCAQAGPGALEHTLRNLYQPTGFNALVISPKPCTGKWDEL
jgi:hypothetical protein